MAQDNTNINDNIGRLIEIMARLRAPDGGCPWDVEQTFQTIAPHTIEEAYEVADAIANEDMQALRDELGDLLFQVVFHARMAEEAGLFDFDAVAGAIADKMVRRHPHVFGDETIDGAEAQTIAWEEHKARERAENGTGGGESALDGVISALPALSRAVKLQKRAARVGFDWPEAAPVVEKLREEIGELEAVVADGGEAERLADELGDLLFTGVNLARKLGIDPETALRGCNAKFERRFRRVEAALARDGRSMAETDIDALEALWQDAKKTDRA